MAAQSITTSFTVSFSSSEEGLLVAEVDDRADGLNGGNTSFAPGDDVGFLVFPGPDVTVSLIDASLGNVTSSGTSSKEIIETFTFIKPGSLTQQLGYPIDGALSASVWIGKTLGNFVLDGTVLKCIPSDSTPDGSVGILKVKYNADCTQHYLKHTPPTDDLIGNAYEIAVNILGTYDPTA